MATTKYTVTLRMEFAEVSARDKIYDRLKTAVASAKADTTIASAQIQKDEYTKPDMSVENL